MSLVEIKGLTKKFGDFTALDDIDLTTKEGEVFGFIGPNGAGKTTTIRVMLGLLKATRGEVKIFGGDAWQDAVELHKRIAFVPGEANLWPKLTGGEVIDLFFKIGGSGNQDRRDEMIKRFDLDPTKKCCTYSKGNRQKVALIAAFSSDADLYILDEPTSGLDPLKEKVFQDLVMEVRAAGKSVFLSSHILSEVEKLCDTIAIIREGKVIETGTLSEMRHLTRTNLTIRTKEPVTALSEAKGVHDLEEHDSELSFQVDTEELDAIMRYISQFGIVKLESAPPTLEDLFLRHYAGTEQNSVEVGGQQ